MSLVRPLKKEGIREEEEKIDKNNNALKLLEATEGIQELVGSVIEVLLVGTAGSLNVLATSEDLLEHVVIDLV